MKKITKIKTIKADECKEKPGLHACWLEWVFLESCQGIQNPGKKKDGKEGPCIFLLTHSLSLGLFLLSLDTVPACAQLKDHENINAKGI